ncbi:MAG: type II secretion system secretin GspD [Thermodesulfobacteriota bacterium]|nr:type II secretion system secretin GspD [Thermodesulfobacteriota bacterium]
MMALRLNVKELDDINKDRHILKFVCFLFMLICFSGCVANSPGRQKMEKAMPAAASENQLKKDFSEESGREENQNNQNREESDSKDDGLFLENKKNTPDNTENISIIQGIKSKENEEIEEKQAALEKKTAQSKTDKNPFAAVLKANREKSEAQQKLDRPSVSDKNISESEHAQQKTDSEQTVAVELAFDNADLFEVLDATLYELFKVNYIIDPHVRAKVSFHFSGEYTESEFVNLLNSVMQLNNLSILHGPGNMYRVVRKTENDSLTTAPVTAEALPNPVGDISRFIKLRYIDCTTAARNIRSFASKGVRIVMDRINNAVIVTDTKENINKIVSLISMMDVPYFKDVSWRIFPINEVDASDIASDILRIVKSTGLYNRSGALKGGYQILPLKSMNAILVVTRWPAIIDLTETWIAAMDQGDDSGSGVFVYFVENGTAAELSDILKQLYGGQKTSSSSRKKQIVDTASGDKGSSPETTVSGELSGDIEIIPDETNNAIVFKATARDYKIIKKVLKELDVIPRQVLINVVIAEITLDKKNEYGVQWLLNNKFGKYSGQGGLDINESSRVIDQVLGKINGLSYGVFNSADVLNGLVTAMGSDSDINILSSPNIMVVDNKEARIEVGEDIPTITGSVTSSDGGVTNTVQYKKTGIILTVTPRINSNGLVKMELSQEVSERGTLDPAASNYSILTRVAETALVVHDGQTILMAGLMRGKDSTSSSGVPLLRDIPFLGYFFNGTSRESTKTELMFLLTPHVVNTREKADQVTEEFSNKIENIKDLIENNTL